jgi:integrase
MSGDRVDIQGYSQELENEVQRIDSEEDLTDSDKEKLLDFIDWRKNQASDGRILQNASKAKIILRENPDLTLSQLLEKKENVEMVNRQIRESSYWSGDYKNSTKDEYRKAVKRLIEYWYKDEDPEKMKAELLPKGFSTNTHTLGENIDPRKTPSASDVKELCQALEARTDTRFAARDVAASMTMWDVGCRISGILRMNVGDVNYNREGNVNEVTAPAVKDSPRRPVELTVAEPALEYYLENVHPEPDNEDAPLFCTLKGSVRRLNPRDFGDRLDKAKMDTGLNIQFNPHNWRRGRATFVVIKDIFDIRTAATRGGWKNIETIDGYLQQTMEDVNKTVRQVYEKEKVEEDVMGPRADLLPLNCSCGVRNSGHRSRCRGCGSLLDEEAVPEGPSKDENFEEKLKLQAKIEDLEETAAELGIDLDL